MAQERKTIRLRASCNACNESKVRCSQRKPTCARCERNGIECIFGMSRRTHKDAPPLSMPPSQRPRGPSRSSSNGETIGNPKWGGLPTPSHCGDVADRSDGTHDATNLFANYMSLDTPQSLLRQHHQHDITVATTPPQFHMYTPQQAPTPADQLHRSRLLLDANSLFTSGSFMEPPSTTVTRPPTPGNNLANLGDLESLFGDTSNSDTSTGISTDISSFWARQMAALDAPPTTTTTTTTTPLPPLPAPKKCTCHSGVTELLTSMRNSSSADDRIPLDAHLLKLKRCILSSETSLQCPHNPSDTEPIHIIPITTLLSHVIDDFRSLATEFHNPSPSTPEPSGHADEPPRLSWGVLSLSHNDELELRQRLYQLSFRKLERLLAQLTVYLRDLDDARASLPDPSRQMMFLMACNYMRRWLESKAEDVKELFEGGDGAVGLLVA